MPETREQRCGAPHPHDHHHWAEPATSTLICCDGQPPEPSATITIACQFGNCIQCPGICACACHMTCSACNGPMPAAVANWHIGPGTDNTIAAIRIYCSETCANA